MNPFSHYDLEKPEFQTELQQTIYSIEKLNGQIANVKKIQTIEKLEREVVELTGKLAAKEKLVHELGAKLKAKQADAPSQAHLQGTQSRHTKQTLQKSLPCSYAFGTHSATVDTD